MLFALFVEVFAANTERLKQVRKDGTVANAK
jgi:hypothetical protein